MKLSLAWLCIVSLPTFAAPSPAAFHRAVYALHEQQIAQREIRTEEATGNYEGAAAARYRYVETSYYDKASGRMISRVRRDAAMPELVHIAEVNVYDDAGKLVRDFGSVTLPWAPLHPVRTFINLHHHNGGLHSFRQYDVSGLVGYEFCEGKLDNKAVRISLDGSDIDAASASGAAYQACFDGLSKDWARYTTPH
ncbi:MAG: hypothetical protein IV108_12435 [Burkholderiales bacterium]|nr:hypothetical protein [Burkholderiales bacterium]